jgi:SAM-dependent methyltransferase
MSSRSVTACRLCGSTKLEQVLGLESTPLANQFVDKQGVEQEIHPLVLLECQVCGHVQLSAIVDPDTLFRDYVYVSGTSPVFVDHFRDYAKQSISRFGLEKDDLVVDIGSNDGTLLGFFKEAGMKVLGVDPATNIARRATESGIETLPEFFNYSLSKRITEERGQASLVVANNVFAHIHDLASVVKGVQRLLKPDGIFVFEVSYLLKVCENTLFDTIYHEHLSYHHVAPLVSFFESAGLRLFQVQMVDTHGGSLRCYVGSRDRRVTPSVDQFCRKEASRGLFVPGRKREVNIFERLNNTIKILGKTLTDRLKLLKSQGKKIAGYGAPAKVTTLMHQFGLDSDTIDFIVDDSPLKQGLFTPGKHIPVLPSSAIEEKKPDYLLILAWNFADPIIEKCKSFQEAGGKFIVPLPRFREC